MLNLYRDYPFLNKKILPILEFNILVPSDVEYMYIKRIDSNGIYIYSNNDTYSFTAKDIHKKELPIYIYNAYEEPIGSLLLDSYLPYPIEFDETSTRLLDSVVYRENLNGVRKIYIKKDNKYIRMKPNIVISQGTNIIIDSDGTYNAYSDFLVSGYLKSLNGTIVGSHSTIFGRNIIMVNGDQFGTTIDDPNLICPTAFKPGSIGDQGGPGNAGRDGQDGEIVYDFFNNPDICDPNCACYDNPAECTNPFSEDVCSLPEVICTNCDSDDDSDYSGGGGGACTVCDGCDSEEPEPEPEPEPVGGCNLADYTNVETVELVESISPTLAPLFKISDGVFAYDHWNPDIEEEYITFNIPGLIPGDTILKFSNVTTDSGTFEFCCMKCITYEDNPTVYVLKPSKNCDEPFSYYVDGDNVPITFYSTWVTEDGALRKDLYVLYESGLTKRVLFTGGTETYYSTLYAYPDYFGDQSYTHNRVNMWKNDNPESDSYIERSDDTWTLHIGTDSIYTLVDSESYGEGEYTYVSGSEPEAPATIYVYKDSGPLEAYINDWMAYVLNTEDKIYSGPLPYYEASMFQQSDYKKDPYYVSGEEFSLICGTYTHIPNFINADGTSTHEFITPFEGPMKTTIQGDSSIQVYDAMNTIRWEEFSEWQQGGEGGA